MLEENQEKKEAYANEFLRKRLCQLCKAKGQTYYTLSYQSSVPLTTLLHIVHGNSKNPGIFTMMKICDGLGVSLQEFFGPSDYEKKILESLDEKETW